MDAEESEGPTFTKPRGRDHFSVFRKHKIPAKLACTRGEILRDHIREMGGAR